MQVEIWYYTLDAFQFTNLTREPATITLESMQQTHRLIRTEPVPVGHQLYELKERLCATTHKGTDKQELLADFLEVIYQLMQGENWSPNGEANAVVYPLGVGHVSMSVGDIIGYQEKYYVVMEAGFQEVRSGITGGNDGGI